MRLLWNFVGNSTRYATRVQGLQVDTFQMGFDGALVLPAKGDVLKLNVSGISEPALFVCMGRRFDLASQGGAVLRIDLDLAPLAQQTAGADPTSFTPPQLAPASVR